MAENEIGWAVLELMGHIRLGGYVTEEERFGSKIGRIDVHGAQGIITTQYFGGSSIYRITPTTEQIAKSIGARSEAPIQRWELKALEASDVRHTTQDMYDDATDDDDLNDDENSPPF